jgi:hypothetical protein
MIRPKLFAFSKNKSTAKSVAKYISVFKGWHLKHDFDSEKHSLCYHAIEEITQLLDAEEPDTLLDSAVVFDCSDHQDKISAETLDPTAEGIPTSMQIVGTLLLAYPEVYWILLGTNSNKPVPGADNVLWSNHFVDSLRMADMIDLLVRHQNGYRLLFDPSGIRTAVKQQVLKRSKNIDASTFKEEVMTVLENRECQRAVAIDEESSYVFLHGYAAYRLGYRSNIVTSKSELEELQKEKYLNNSVKNKFLVSFEDMELKLTDMVNDDEPKINGTPDWSGLEERRKTYDFLPPCKNQRLIITGVGEDKAFIKKPTAGIYALLEELAQRNLYRRPRFKSLKATSLKKLGCLGQLLSWFKLMVPHKVSRKMARKARGHSATNKVLKIAEMLIGRSYRIADQMLSAEEAIHSALVALEASEILYGRSMTTALESFSSQHQMEVRAECSFYGVSHEIFTEPRFEEIAYLTDSIIRISAGQDESKISSSLNAQIEMINNIRISFKDFEQFDEEDRCIDQIRKLTQGLHFYSTIYSNRGGRIKKYFKRLWTFLGERYFNFLMSAGWKLGLAVLTWTSAFALSYLFILGNSAIDISNLDFVDAFFRAVVKSGQTFFSLQPNEVQLIDGNNDSKLAGLKYFDVLLVVQFIIAYSHLGIFIAWLYQKLSRR